MPNFEKIKELRNHLQWLVDNKKEYKFNMDQWITHVDKDALRKRDYEVTYTSIRNAWKSVGITDPISPYECGTVACLAGHVAMLNVDDTDKLTWSDYKNRPEDIAIRVLGLDRYEADYMFIGAWRPMGTGTTDITITQAIKYLDRVLNAGTVYVHL